MPRFAALLAFSMLALCAGTASAISVSIDPVFNGSFANARTKLSVVMNPAENASALWYRADNGTEIMLPIIGSGYPGKSIASFFADLEECGNHTLAFYANGTDASVAEADVAFVYDSLPPEAPAITQPLNGSVLRSAVTLSWNASADSCSGARQEYNVSLSGCANFSTFTNATTLALPVADGQCSLFVTAYDSVEPLAISNSATSVAVFSMDTTGPSIAVLSPPSRTYSRAVWFNVTIGRNGTCTVWNGTHSVAMTALDGMNFSVSSYAREGQNNATFNCTDHYNHTSTRELSFFVDTAPPTKTLVSVDGDNETPYNATRPSVDVRLGLNEPGTCRMSPDNRSYSSMANYTQCGPGNSTSVSCKELLQDGQYARYVACTDGYNEDATAGAIAVNFSVSVLYRAAFSVDSSGYVRAGGSREYAVSVTNDGNGNLTSLNLSASSSMNSSWFSLSDAAYSLVKPAEGRTAVLRVDPPSSAENATYTFIVYANATQLNLSYSFTIEVRSREPPAVQAAAPAKGTSGSGVPVNVVEMYPQGYINSRAVTLWVRTDKKATCRIDEQDGGFEELKSTMLTADGMNHTYRFSGLAGGEHEYKIRCMSEGGVAMTSSSALKFGVDMTAPLTAVKRLDPEQNSTEFQVSWDGQDSPSGIAGYDIQVKKDGGEWETWLQATAEKSATFKAEAGHVYSFRSIGKDNAGNVEVKIVGQDDTYTSVAGPSLDAATDGATGLFPAISLFDGFDGVEASIAGVAAFLRSNIAAIVMGIAAVAVVLASRRAAGSIRYEGRPLRKHVMDEWRNIKRALK